MNTIFKRICCIVISVFMVAVLFSGCGKDNSDTSDNNETTQQTTAAEETKEQEEAKGIEIDPGKQIKLRFFTGSTVNQMEMEQGLTDFNQKYPNIEVETVLLPGAEYYVKVKTSIAAGEQVDIIEESTSSFDRTNAQDMYYPLEDLLKKDGMDIEKEYGSYYKQFTTDDIIYGIPKALAPSGVWYNKKHFEEAGIPEPTPDWTLDDFFDIAKKLTIKDSNGNVTRYGAYDWSFSSNSVGYAASFTALYGGWQILKPDGSLNMNDPRIKKALQYYYDASMVDKSIPDVASIAANNYHFMYDMYKGKWSMLISARNTAMFLDIHRMNGQLLPEEDDEGIYKLAYMPRWDKNSPVKLARDTVSGDFICKNTKEPEASYIFVKWHTTDCLVKSSKVAHRLPAARNVDINALMDNWTYYKNQDGQIVKGKDRPELFKVMTDPEIVPIYPDVEYKFGYSTKLIDELNKEMSIVFIGEKELDKGLEDAIASMQKVVDEETKK